MSGRKPGIENHPFLQFLRDQCRPVLIGGAHYEKHALRVRTRGVHRETLDKIIKGSIVPVAEFLDMLAQDAYFKPTDDAYEQLMTLGKQYIADCAAKLEKPKVGVAQEPAKSGNKATNPVMVVLQRICGGLVVSEGVDRTVAKKGDPITRIGRWEPLTLGKFKEQCGYKAEVDSIRRATTKGLAEDYLQQILKALLVQKDSPEWQDAHTALDTLGLKVSPPKKSICYKRQPSASHHSL